MRTVPTAEVAALFGTSCAGLGGDVIRKEVMVRSAPHPVFFHMMGMRFLNNVKSAQTI